MEQAIGRGLLAVPRPARRGRRAGGAGRPQPRHGRPAGRLATTCWVATRWPPKRSRAATAEPWPTFTWARPTSPWVTTTRLYKITPRPPRAATTPTIASWPAPTPSAAPAILAAALALLDNLSGAVEQTAEYLYQRAACVVGHRRQSARGRGAVRAGRRSRPQPRRRPVRAGPGKRSPRQRRSGTRPLRAGGTPVSLACRTAVEPGYPVRRSSAVRSGAGSATSGFWTCFRPTAGHGCS